MGPSTGKATEPDLTLVAELTEEIERHPPAIGAKTLLVHHYISIGWFDAAVDLVEELKRHAPQDEEILNLAETVKQVRIVSHTDWKPRS